MNNLSNKIYLNRREYIIIIDFLEIQLAKVAMPKQKRYLYHRPTD